MTQTATRTYRGATRAHRATRLRAMRHLLLNLRDVPDDEADEVRALLAEHAIAFYETEPNRWGISAGGLWTRDADDAAKAKPLLADYQRERAERMREAHDQARRDGTAPTFWRSLRGQPVQVAAILFAIGCVLALSLWPFLLGD